MHSTYALLSLFPSNSQPLECSIGIGRLKEHVPPWCSLRTPWEIKLCRSMQIWKQPHTVHANKTQLHSYTHCRMYTDSSATWTKWTAELKWKWISFSLWRKRQQMNDQAEESSGGLLRYCYLCMSQKTVNTQDRCLLGPNYTLLLTKRHIKWSLMHVRLADKTHSITKHMTLHCQLLTS